MNKIINIDNTELEVKLLHSRKSLIYFIKNVLGKKLINPQKKLIKLLEKRNKIK